MLTDGNISLSISKWLNSAYLKVCLVVSEKQYLAKCSLFFSSDGISLGTFLLLKPTYFYLYNFTFGIINLIFIKVLNRPFN